MKPELYGFMHKTVKKILKRNNDLSNAFKLVSFPASAFENGIYKANEAGIINEIKYNEIICQNDVYPVENLAYSSSEFMESFSGKVITFHYANTLKEAESKWKKFISSAVIQNGYRNEGLLYAGFIKEMGEWCLPSWIWTNSAIVRWYCLNGEIDKAKKLGNRILALQQECGGWIVRNDYGKDGAIPQLAPNDSCYIALNCCLELFEATNDIIYLKSAQKCADWVRSTAREDGLVLFSYDTLKNKWITDKNIVDTGFTAGLFAKLYEITGDKDYKIFLSKFVIKYIDVFFMRKYNAFATAIDKNDKQYGGAFGRGQGWALEGLIPAYKVLKDENIKVIIKNTINTLLYLQKKDGGWSYNLLKPLMGDDCKAVPVIAKCLLEWYEIENDDRLIKSAKNALNWCVKHTASNSIAEGGIFSYTIEGAVVHHMYTNTAFTYGSSYALEVSQKLKGKLDGKGFI